MTNYTLTRRRFAAVIGVTTLLLSLAACGPSTEEACPLTKEAITGIVGTALARDPQVSDRSGDGLYGGASRPQCTYTFALDLSETGINNASFESLNAKDVASYKAEFFVPFDAPELVPEWGDAAWIQLDRMGAITAKFEAGGRWWRMDMQTSGVADVPDAQDHALQTARDVVNAVVTQTR